MLYNNLEKDYITEYFLYIRFLNVLKSETQTWF